MKDILNSFIELDSNFLNGNKNNLMKNKTINTRTNENKIRINELKSNVEKRFSEYNEDQKSMINSFFTKMFLDEIFEKNNAIKSFEKTHIIFLFLLDTSLLDKYFTSFGYFINVDYTLIQLYSILRNQNMSVKLNEKIIGFIKKYNAPNNLGFSFMGIMNNQKIFNSFFKYKNISELYNYNLYDIIKYIIGKLFLNLRENEGIIQKFMNIFLKIIEYINQHYKINQNLANQEFYLLGKIFLEIEEKVKKYRVESQLEIDNTNEKEKEKENITQINSISFLSTLYSSVFPEYIKSIYNILSKCLENKSISLENKLDNAFLSFFIVLDLLSDEKNINEILSSKIIDAEIVKFFQDFQCFNINKQYLIVNLKYFELFFEKYNKLRDEPSKKIFLDYFYLFSLLKGKHEEKNLKSVVIEFFGEYQDNRTKEDFKKYGYITCYFLSSIKRDSINGNKNTNEIMLNYIDFSIIKNIGERFKDDEKSLKKNL
jgi:hypothetical protein